MRRGSARLACLFGALMALSLGGSAQAGPRIVNGSPASPGEYPAQGFLEVSTSAGDFVCGGTLVSNRYFLTAAHCATELNSTTPLDASALTVTLGKVDTNDFEPSDRFAVAENRVNAAYDLIGPANNVPDSDIALLRLATSAPPRLEPLRIVEPEETGLWAAGDTATVIGWGVTEANVLSDLLLEATVPMRTDADCSAVWGSRFRDTTMVCAGGGATDTCGGDSGGPLMVSDGAFLILAGITSWGAEPCADPDRPGVYTRLGDPVLNAWVRAQVPIARATVADRTPDTSQAVEFSVTTTDPGIPPFTNFAWDFESDGVTDANGANPTHTYPTAGRFIARVRATGAPGDPDTAVAKVRVDVAQAPPAPTPTPTPAPIVTAPPPTTEPVPRTRLATILTLNRPRVRRGRLKMRINFAMDAPAGNAFVELFRGRKKIGSIRARVRRGGSRQVSVKLTRAGRKLLRRSERRRMRVKVQVRVHRRILGSKTLTIRL